MKKNIFKVILLLLVIFSYSSVFADDKEHIYFVEKLEFNDEIMKIEGYSFVSQVDNYGKRGTKGNLTNYLVAYTGTDVNIGTDGKCYSSDGGKCKILELDTKARDFFWSRCVSADSSRAGSCTYDKYNRYKHVNSAYKFSDSCSSGDSYCMYYDVGFSKDIYLDDLIIELYGDNKINFNLTSGLRFKIFSKIEYNGLIEYYGSKLAVSSQFCKIGESNECVNGVNSDSGLYSIRVAGISNKVLFEASGASGQIFGDDGLKSYGHYKDNSARFYQKGYIEDGTSLKEEDYLYEVDEIREMDRSTWGPTIKEKFFKLKSLVIDKEYLHIAGKSILTADFSIVPYTNKNISKYAGKIVESNIDIWAFSNWVQIFGDLEIKGFEPQYTELTCENIKNKKEKRVLVLDATCDDNESANEEFYQCERENTIKATIYINLGDSNDDKPTCGGFELRDLQFLSNDGTIEGKGYVLPVQVETAVLLEQTGNFHFANFSPQLVYAGKGFSINNNVANGISYNNTFRWLFGNVIIETSDLNYKGTPYISYIGALLKNENGSCVKDTNFVDTALKNAFADVDENKNKIFYEKGDKLVGATNTLNAVVYAIDEVLKSKYDISKYDDGTSKFDDVQFESCDSNSKSSTCDNKLVSGVWSESKDVNPWSFIYGDVAFDDIYAHRGFGIKRETKLAYQLPHAYVVLSDIIFNGKKYKNGDKIYSTNKMSDADIATYNLEYVGNQYYVGFKYVYDKINESDFPFNIVNKDISLVKGMTWNLSGTCGVEVKNKFYKKIIPQCSKGNCGVEAKISYKFRPISLSNPFPRPQSIATNWEKWIETNPEATRIKDTKDYGVKYSIRLSKFDIDDAVMLSNINSYSSKHGSYDELNGYEVDGSGAFINKSNNISFSIKQGTTSYCGLGYFSSNCDQYANIMG